MADRFQRNFWFYKASYCVLGKPSENLSLKDAINEIYNLRELGNTCECDFSPSKTSHDYRYSGCISDIYREDKLAIILLGAIDREHDQAVGDERNFNFRNAAMHDNEHTAEAIHILIDFSEKVSGYTVIVEKGNVISPHLAFKFLNNILKKYVQFTDGNDNIVQGRLSASKSVDSSLKEELNGAEITYFDFKRKPINDELHDEDIAAPKESKLIFKVKEKNSFSWVNKLLASKTAKKYEDYTLKYRDNSGNSHTASSRIADIQDILSDLVHRRVIIQFDDILPPVCHEVHEKIRDKMIEVDHTYLNEIISSQY
ncbi:hypothetical protein NQF87_00055 [Bombella sp. TMW 2.2559]|uniref:Uncharacterized protein n=1 Tax=Bombella dulcis TaxID=2967339 RepID=A0ABT3WC86_9PROT|nr:hypothetical protein [Bombella dulcis]MCX5615377.1 hypothetical protein [Bombella dulcis]